METKKTIEKIKHNELNIMAKTQHELSHKLGAVQPEHEHHHRHHHSAHHTHHHKHQDKR